MSVLRITKTFKQNWEKKYGRHHVRMGQKTDIWHLIDGQILNTLGHRNLVTVIQGRKCYFWVRHFPNERGRISEVQIWGTP